MKKLLLTLAMAFSLTTALMAAPAQQEELKNDTVDEVEVFSDTTSVDSTYVDGAWDDWSDDWDGWDDWEPGDGRSLMGDIGIDGGDLLGVLLVIAGLFLLFVLAPVAIIGLILYFVYKNRKDRIRMMEMALKNGKKIPVDVMGNPVVQNDALWSKSIKQMFLGAGLGILLWIVIGKLGLGIGALILLIGLGNFVIAYHAKSKQHEQEMRDLFNTSKEEE